MPNKYRQFPTTGGENPALKVVRKPKLPPRAVPKGTATHSAATRSAVKRSASKPTFTEKGKSVKKSIKRRGAALRQIMQEID